MRQDDDKATTTINPASDPLRVARIKEAAVARRARKAKARLATWTGQRAEVAVAH